MISTFNIKLKIEVQKVSGGEGSYIMGSNVDPITISLESLTQVDAESLLSGAEARSEIASILGRNVVQQSSNLIAKIAGQIGLGQ